MVFERRGYARRAEAGFVLEGSWFQVFWTGDEPSSDS